jgi:hypothetical protein
MLVLALMPAGLGCSKPKSEDCKKAIANIRKLTGATQSSIGRSPEAAIRACRGGASRESVQCVIDAKTLADLNACEGGMFGEMFPDAQPPPTQYREDEPTPTPDPGANPPAAPPATPPAAPPATPPTGAPAAPPAGTPTGPATGQPEGSESNTPPGTPGSDPASDPGASGARTGTPTAPTGGDTAPKTSN